VVGGAVVGGGMVREEVVGGGVVRGGVVVEAVLGLIEYPDPVARCIVH